MHLSLPSSSSYHDDDSLDNYSGENFDPHKDCSLFFNYFEDADSKDIFSEDIIKIIPSHQ